VLHNIGGAEYVTIVLMNTLREQGHQIILMSDKKIAPEHISFFFGKSLKVDANILPLLNAAKWIPRKNPIMDYMDALQSYVLKLNCQILIDTYNDFVLPWNDITYFQERERSIFPRSSPSFSSFLRAPLFKSSMTEKKTLFVVSKFLAGFLEKKGVHCSVLYPPVDVSYFSKDNENLSKPRKDMVVTFSRFAREKKLQNIPIIASNTDEDVSFVIAGSCQSTNDYMVLQTLINKLDVADRVKLLPNIPRGEVRNLLWNSKVCLHARENEPFGITIIEAMASGCIPVVHDSGGPREFVPESFRYKTIEEAVLKVEKTVSSWNPEKSRQISAIADKFSEKEFSRRFLDVFNLYVENVF
jgi:glycosyltransferase involved in cell wall biosynthesis